VVRLPIFPSLTTPCYLLRRAGWFSVQLLFEYPGYERFRTNYSTLNVNTNSPNGEPFLDAGDIFLHPASK